MNKNFISEIEAINFQSHSHTHLVLSPGVNVFKGSTHSGKSAIMRLLEWIFFNSLRGDGFKSHFAKKNEDTEGTVVFSEGTYVTRRKGKKNSYLSEDLSLDAVRTDVPDEIKEITKIGEVNFQKQGDKHYLIDNSYSPGAVGKKLNDIVGLGIIDETKTKINKIINDTSLRLKINREETEETEQKLIAYDHLDKVEKLINKLTALFDKSQAKSVRYDRIESIVNDIKPIRKELIKLKKKARVEEDYNALLVKVFELRNKKDVHTKIMHISASILHHEAKLKGLKAKIVFEMDYTKLVEKYKSCAERRFKRVKILNIYNDMQKAEKSAKSLRELLTARKKRESELQKSLAYCQYCGADKKYWRER